MDKIRGIVYAYDVGTEYDMVKEAGFQWIRLGISFPWADRMYGTLSKDYLAMKKHFEQAHAYGMHVMPATPPLGGFFYNEQEGRTRWHESFPAFIGEKGTAEFSANVSKAMKFVCEDLGDMAGDLWQCMNEPDIPIFSNDYSIDIIAATARATADGIRQANPRAMCGINISNYTPRALEILDAIHSEGSPMQYVGVDQYFGSWQGGDVENWIPEIDALYERYHLPVLINEWGYSSGGDLAAEKPDPAVIPEGLTEVCYAKKWFYAAEGMHTPQVQADYLRRGIEIFARHPHVLGSFLFCWRDAHHCYHCGEAECPAECFWGIVDKDCNPKPAYYAVQEAMRKTR